MSRKRKRRYFKKHKTHQKPELLEGILSCTAGGGFGFVRVEGECKDLFVESENFNTANHGDRVKVKTLSHIKGERRRPCKVVEVLERTITRLTGVVIADFGGVLAVKADDSRFYPTIQVSLLDSLGASIGDRVTVVLTEFDTYGEPLGIIMQNLGSSKTIKGTIDSIIFSNFIKTDFDRETLMEAEAISDSIPDTEIAKRLDLREEKIFTIDGDDAKDFDDAVSIRKLPGGGYRLGVHIADVSHYVRQNSAIDTEAFERGTSVYLPDRVIPMLPEHLSNGVCSLVPFKDRLTMSCIMTINKGGTVTNYKIQKSVIRSLHRMTYTEVDKILLGDKALCKKYKDILTSLSHMNDLSDILSKKRKMRGSIDFDLPETKVELSENYNIGEVTARERLKSHKIIEEFMLLANETVAKHSAEHNLPIIYRTHKSPMYDKLKALKIVLKSFGLSLPEDINEITPKAFQNLLDGISDEALLRVISKLLLRSMAKAEYKKTNDGHFGLASDYYCHFTSPIRRYPDLLVARALSGEIIENRKAISVHSTETERKAEECERSCVAFLKVLYMKEHIGEEFPAAVTSLCEFGIWAELENTIEGMIRLETISGDYYIYDEKTASTVGKRTGRSFKIGDRINVVVKGADTEHMRIDFELKEDKRCNLK